MRSFRFVTLDVFTTTRFGGNPLAVFPDARGLTDAEMQALAREFNLSETTFVLPPSHPAHTAQVRIFTPVAEMPFAGHPNVGTGWVLAEYARDNKLIFEEIAGLVHIELGHEDGRLATATIAAPQPLASFEKYPAEALAPLAGLSEDDILTTTHLPVRASVGNPFLIAEVTPEALTRAAPNQAEARKLAANIPQLKGRAALYIYARDGERIRTRMFSSTTMEDPATGSAATPLAALLLAMQGGTEGAWDMVQGVEMGRPSLLKTRAWLAGDGYRASVGGSCVPVFSGEVTLD
ncbi:PhzF family phenazine biosynthesis protein [Rhodovarius crocodyli]|uniref:PhzF family phenazine biosynthesis protein n=1 Tax=Rhodovarius crocodyli TaxID=1979269 RepID=A0A437MD59_9PROT|nr:PhzF family phenazine biosynthesis protein [Rhodovarius crocodyli]RVT95597.1 PhzF family phenazine biosynthesis protein [Rhodovarius crocodyli]